MTQRQQKQQSLDTMGSDTLTITLKSLPLSDLLPMRLVNKSTRDVVDAEIVRRHKAMFGPTDKAIGLRIKDLNLESINKKLRPLEPALYSGAQAYGLAAWFGADREDTNMCVQALTPGFTLFMSSEMFEGLQRFRDYLLQRFPQYRDSILVGYYNHLDDMRDYWNNDDEDVPILETLATPEAVRYLAMPMDDSLLQHLLSFCRSPQKGLKPDNIIHRISWLREAYVTPEYGLDVLLDADGRQNIRKRIRELPLSKAEKDVLKQYFKYHCQRAGLDPMGSWGREHPEAMTAALHEYERITAKRRAQWPEHMTQQTLDEIQQRQERQLRQLIQRRQGPQPQQQW